MGPLTSDAADGILYGIGAHGIGKVRPGPGKASNQAGRTPEFLRFATSWRAETAGAPNGDAHRSDGTKYPYLLSPTALADRP
jgi:hypothetical protein